MQPYQNSYVNPQMNQPNMGMYQNFNQPMNNPYADRMAQLQNYQQNLQMSPTQMSGTPQQPQGIIGRVVNDFNEITANDVPMNGVSAVFPKSDMSEIQLRTWAANGTIQTITYKPILEQNQSEGTNIPQNNFTALNDGINAFREEILIKLDGLEQSIKNSPTKTSKTSPRPKKEVNADE